jgi:hypothetical protein
MISLLYRQNVLKSNYHDALYIKVRINGEGGGGGV